MLWFVARKRARKRADYRDPLVEVEIAQTAAIVRSAGREFPLPYPTIRVRFTVYRHKGSTHFLGLVMESPLGPLRLDDSWFKPGRTVAAALAGRLDANGVLPKVGD